MEGGSASGLVVEADAPAAAEDAVVRFDQGGEGIPGRNIESLDRIGRHEREANSLRG